MKSIFFITLLGLLLLTNAQDSGTTDSTDTTTSYTCEKGDADLEDKNCKGGKDADGNYYYPDWCCAYLRWGDAETWTCSLAPTEGYDYSSLYGDDFDYYCDNAFLMKVSFFVAALTALFVF